MEDTLIRLVLRNKLVWLYMCICITWATLLAHLLGDPIRAFGVVVGCAPGTMMITVSTLIAYGSRWVYIPNLRAALCTRVL
jgi:hypothetical protein